MGTFIALYVAIGVLVGLGLLSWAFVSSVRHHGLVSTVRGAIRTYLRELPLYWRVPVVAWMFVIALPLLAAWAIIRGNWDPVGSIFVALIWLFYLALLRWHYRAKAQSHDVQRAQR